MTIRTPHYRTLADARRAAQRAATWLYAEAPWVVVECATVCDAPRYAVRAAHDDELEGEHTVHFIIGAAA